MATQDGPASPRAGYFLYGEEPWFSAAALERLKADLLPDGEASETFHLDETKWPEILDAARTSPFLFAPRRLVVVRFPEPAAGPDKPPKGRKKGRRDADAVFSEPVQAALQAYFADPPAGTVLVVVFPGDEKAGAGIVRFFRSLAGENLEVREGRKLKGKDLLAWIAVRAQALGRPIDSDAAERLAGFANGDLRRLSSELDKLAVATAGRSRIAAADVDALTVNVRSYQNYELVDALMDGDASRAVAICERQLESEGKPTAVVGRLADFFRGLAWAKDRLAVGATSPPEVFEKLFPYIKKEWPGLYARKSGALFRLLDGLTDRELARILGDLSRVDELMKTSDTSPLAAIEGFLLSFFISRRARPGRRPGG
jgi:DNA polymerase-3 subunit delta